MGAERAERSGKVVRLMWLKFRRGQRIPVPDFSSRGEPIEETWRRLSEGRASITDKAFRTLMDRLTNPTVLDVTSEPINNVLILPKIDPKAQWYVAVTGGFYNWDISTAKKTLKDEKLSAPTNAVLFNYEGHVYVMVDLPSSGMDKTWLFTSAAPDTTTKLIRQARAIYRKMNREEPSIQVYNGNNVKFSLIRDLPYVPPSAVMKVWNQRILPQMEGKKVYDHVLFSGPPGTGKTAFCRWVATQPTCKGWKFMFVPPEVLNTDGYIGRVFHDAKTVAPSVLVFEDIDLVGRTRLEMSEGFSPKLGELLNRLDGVEPRHTTLILASTNNMQALDPALLRHGRLGIKLELRYTAEEKLRIFKSYCLDADFHPDISDEDVTIAVKAIESPVKIKMVAKMAEIYEKHDKQKLTLENLQRIVEEIENDKPAAFISDSIDNDEEAEEKPKSRPYRFAN